MCKMMFLQTCVGGGYLCMSLRKTIGIRINLYDCITIRMGVTGHKRDEEEYKRQRIPKGQSKMDNPEKPATWDTQD